MYPIYSMYDPVVLQQQTAMYHDHQIKQILD